MRSPIGFAVDDRGNRHSLPLSGRPGVGTWSLGHGPLWSRLSRAAAAGVQPRWPLSALRLFLQTSGLQQL